ncbi:MAG: DNA alkylation response protein [Proteobacteria bacterium]|nr:DNA alkylation response protein [Pseudomonadota bacterium]
MRHRKPLTELATHDVINQSPPLGDISLYVSDAALRGAVEAGGGDQQHSRLAEFGEQCGTVRTREWARQANDNPPRLKSFDRYGRRLDEVVFHPAYHHLMELGLSNGISGCAWSGKPAGHLLHGAMMILMTQADAGVTCPMSMTYASIAALRATPELAGTWEPRVTAQRYDRRSIPAREKNAVTIGMAMTEKQGGSDVRSNTTRAERAGDGNYILTGHKWFCSAPMSDAFLTLAQAPDGLTCFLVPRWRPDGERNAIRLMRLKEKLGDRSNASAEIEYHGAWAQRVGEEGRGVPTIIEMVQLTRYDCALGSAGGMRAALVRALWHAAHRRAFGKALLDHPAMRAVLADLILESEAATALVLRVGAGLDQATGCDRSASNDRATVGNRSANVRATAFVRLATPVAKYWICKRQPGFVYEALECHGGAGYVEEGPMPRLFRQSPLNAIWEGSGNVSALDILRAAAREPDSVTAVLAELDTAAGRNAYYDAHLEGIKRTLGEAALPERSARGFARDLGLGLQAAALHWSASPPVFDGFCSQRLDPSRRGLLHGELVDAVDQEWLIERARRALDV